MTNNKNNLGGGKKPSRLTKFHTKVVSPIALRSKAFIINRARPFTPVVVWVQTHPQIFVLCSFFIPTWWFKLIFFSVSSEDECEVHYAPWILLFLLALVFSLKKLNSALYKSLLGNTVGSSEPCARIASGGGKKQSLLKAFIINRARPFTPVVVWVQTHPQIFVLCSFFIPTWWFKLIFFSVSSENELEINFALWILLFLIASVFSLKKLNSALYKSLLGDTAGPSEQCTRIASGGRKQSRLKAFIINRARPFTPVAVWIQTHPRVFVLSAFFIPIWVLKLIRFNINSEYQLEIHFTPWILLFLIALVFSLKKLNSALYKSLLGDIVDPSQPQAMTAFGDDPGIQVVDGIDQALQDIALDVAKKLAALGFQLECLDYSEMVKI